MLERSGLSTLQKLPLSMTLPTWNSSDKHSAERDKSFKKIEQDGMAQRNLLLWSPMQVIGNRQFLFEMGHPLKMDEDGDFPHHSTPRPLHCNDFLPFSASALRRFGQTHSVVKAMRASFFSTNPGVFVIAQLATLAPNLSSATIYSDDSKEEVEVAELWRC